MPVAFAPAERPRVALLAAEPEIPEGAEVLDSAPAAVNPIDAILRLDVKPKQRTAVAMLPTLEAAGIAREQLLELEAAGLLARWERSDGEGWTLTPFAAALLGLELHERFASAGSAVEEVAYWVLIPPPELARRKRPIRLPRSLCEYRIEFPERLIDPSPGPDVLLDDFTGEPVTLFGQAVPIDPKLKPGRAAQVNGQATKARRKAKGKAAPARR